VILTIKDAFTTAYTGECSVATSSREFLEIAPPKITAKEVLEKMIAESSPTF
jgi:hypothetical protein